MLSEITWCDFQKWAHYAQLEPFDEWRADARSAQIVQTVINMFRGKDTPARPLGDFMLKFGKAAEPVEPVKQTWQEQKTIAMMWAAHL